MHQAFQGPEDSPLDERKGQTIEGVRYFESDFEAMGTKLTLLPSRNGNKHALADVIKGLSGNVFGVVKTGGNPLGASQG